MSDRDELHKEYNEGLATFRKSLHQAVELHANARHVPFQGIAPSARLMFARICILGGSINRLCPKIENEPDIWDFTSISVLARSLFEAIMFFEYFCDSSEPDEWLTKMLLIHFHDRCERVRLFSELNKPEDIVGFSGEVEVLRKLLGENPFFQKLQVSRQKELLNGYNPAILTLRQMAEKYSLDSGSMTIFQFLSNYTHPYPVSFLRNDDNRREGLQNETDKMYIPGILTWLAALLDKARKSYLKIPSGIRDREEEVGPLE
jgi:Family of unknown function (DUF5677)